MTKSNIISVWLAFLQMIFNISQLVQEKQNEHEISHIKSLWLSVTLILIPASWNLQFAYHFIMVPISANYIVSIPFNLFKRYRAHLLIMVNISAKWLQSLSITFNPGPWLNKFSTEPPENNTDQISKFITVSEEILNKISKLIKLVTPLFQYLWSNPSKQFTLQWFQGIQPVYLPSGVTCTKYTCHVSSTLVQRFQRKYCWKQLSKNAHNNNGQQAILKAHLEHFLSDELKNEAKYSVLKLKVINTPRYCIDAVISTFICHNNNNKKNKLNVSELKLLCKVNVPYW